MVSGSYSLVVEHRLYGALVVAVCELYSHDPPGFVAPRHVGSSRTGIEPVLPAMAPDYQGKSLLLCFLPEVLLFPHLTLRSVIHFELTSGHDLR